MTCDSSVNREFSTGETADSADNNCYCSQGFYDNEDATVCLDCDYQCWECYDETSADCFDCNNSYTHRSLTNSRTVNSSYWSGAEYNDYLDLDYPLSAGICLCDSRYYDNSSD